MFIYDNWILLY